MIAMRGALQGLPLSSAMLGAVALAGCATSSPSAPLAGWSRAPDLSVYAAMDVYGGIAREQATLCGGFSPVSVRSHWDDDFGGREAAVRAALTERHGADAVARARTEAVQTVPCPDVPDLTWRVHYSRLLRLLEMRLGLA
jgi:hypothetical protein